jgi:hypothetical protein
VIFGFERMISNPTETAVSVAIFTIGCRKKRGVFYQSIGNAQDPNDSDNLGSLVSSDMFARFSEESLRARK